MKALCLLAALLVGCGSNPLESVTPADRVQYTIEALKAACGAYLSSAQAHEPDLDELCKAIVKPVAVDAVPDDGTAGRVAASAGGREG